MWYGRLCRHTPRVAGAIAGISGVSYISSFRVNRISCCHETSFSQEDFRSFPVLEVRKVGPGTNVLKCGLPSPQHVMGMPVTAYVTVEGAEGDEQNPTPQAAYTPITTDDQPGYFELLVKGYPDGNVSKYLCSLQAGDSVSLKGPVAKLPYIANMKKKIGMIAGGSGITPMLQIIKEVLKNPQDKTEITLIFGNQTPADILLREDLDQLATSSKGQVKVLYVVDRNDTNDLGIKHVGHVTPELCRQVLPAPSDDSLIYVCGPPAMLAAVAGKKGFVKGRKFGQGEIGGMLKELGYSMDMVFKF